MRFHSYIFVLFTIAICAAACKKVTQFEPGKTDNISSHFYIQGEFNGKKIHQEIERYYPFHSFLNDDVSFQRYFIYNKYDPLGNSKPLSANPDRIVWDKFRYEFWNDTNFFGLQNRVGKKFKLDTNFAGKNVVREFWISYPNDLNYKHFSQPTDSIRYLEYKDTSIANYRYEIYTLGIDSLQFINPFNNLQKLKVRNLKIRNLSPL